MTQQFARNSVAAAMATAAFAFAAITPVRAADQPDDSPSGQQYLTDDASYDNPVPAVAPSTDAESGFGEPAVTPEGQDDSSQEQ